MIECTGFASENANCLLPVTYGVYHTQGNQGSLFRLHVAELSIVCHFIT